MIPVTVLRNMPLEQLLAWAASWNYGSAGTAQGGEDRIRAALDSLWRVRGSLPDNLGLIGPEDLPIKYSHYMTAVDSRLVTESCIITLTHLTDLHIRYPLFASLDLARKLEDAFRLPHEDD